MKKCVLFILLIALSMAQTESDEAEYILVQLHNDALKNLKDLQDTWAVNGGLLEDNMSSWENTVTSQSQECDHRTAVLSDAYGQQQENERLIEWIKNTVRDKTIQYDKIYDDRCQANRNYINSLKNDKIILQFLEYLKKAYDNSKNKGISLFDKKEFMLDFLQFISLYKSSNTKQMLQMHSKMSQIHSDEGEDTNAGGDHVNDSDFEIDNEFSTSERTAEQIGNKHVDIDREALALENFDSNLQRDYNDLDDLILTIEKQVLIKMAKQQEDEVDAGIAAAEFRLKVEQEINELDDRLYVAAVFSTTIVRKIDILTGESQRCQKQLDSVTVAFEKSQQDYQVAFQKFQDKEKEINEEVEVFAYVLQQYQQNLSGDEYREQLDDYIEDGSYEGDYENREVDDIEFIGDQ